MYSECLSIPSDALKEQFFIPKREEHFNNLKDIFYYKERFYGC